VLGGNGPLILYGPWITDKAPTAPGNLEFDADLKRRNPEWGLRKVEEFAAESEARGFAVEQTRSMPANNMMLLLRRR
jgi:hypothetical protein